MPKGSRLSWVQTSFGQRLTKRMTFGIDFDRLAIKELMCGHVSRRRAIGELVGTLVMVFEWIYLPFADNRGRGRSFSRRNARQLKFCS
jgi:hypothetical protein